MPWYILNQTQVSTKGDFRLNIINQVMNKIHPYRINNPSFNCIIRPIFLS